MSLPRHSRHVPRLLLPPVSGDIKEETLWAGDIIVSRERIRMTTVLGSCIAVCLFDSAARFGGMNHYLLPSPGCDARHGAWSIHELFNRMLSLGGRLACLQAKVFGGGSPLAVANDAAAVGPENARIAFATLEELSVPVVSERVGGNTGMRVYFENWSGAVFVRPHRNERSS